MSESAIEQACSSICQSIACQSIVFLLLWHLQIDCECFVEQMIKSEEERENVGKFKDVFDYSGIMVNWSVVVVIY